MNTTQNRISLAAVIGFVIVGLFLAALWHIADQRDKRGLEQMRACTESGQTISGGKCMPVYRDKVGNRVTEQQAREYCAHAKREAIFFEDGSTTCITPGDDIKRGA